MCLDFLFSLLRHISMVVDRHSSSFQQMNAGVTHGTLQAPTLFFLRTNELLSLTFNPFPSNEDDNTLHSSLFSFKNNIYSLN